MYVGLAEVYLFFFVCLFLSTLQNLLISYLLGKIGLNLSLKNMAMCT